MADPSVVDASPSVAALLRLPLTETHGAVRGVSWLHDGQSAHGEYLLFFVTLWHVCSLLRPYSVHHGAGPVFLANPSALPNGSPTSPLDLDWVLTPLFERLAAAWLSHPMHVPDVQLCDRITGIGSHPSEDSDWDTCPDWNSDPEAEAALALAHAYVGYVQDTRETSSVSTQRVLAWLLDAYGPDHLGGAGLGDRHGGYTNGSAIVLRMDVDAVFAASQWDAHASVAASQGPPPRSRTSPSWEPAVQWSPETHEVHGVGVLIKALVQQNAGAILFLRTMVCVAALLCYVHSILVLGERPSVVGCRKSW